MRSLKLKVVFDGNMLKIMFVYLCVYFIIYLFFCYKFDKLLKVLDMFWNLNDYNVVVSILKIVVSGFRVVVKFV